jgi:uncharacterized repeat protein (TIGR02543 family)
MPGENMTLYAKWTEDVHAYTVYFVMNGHGGQAPNPVQVDVGARIPMPAQPYEAGYTFGGWYTDMACSPGHEWNFNTGAMPANDMTLFAKWTEDSSGGGGGGNSGGGSGGNNDKDKDKNKESDKDKNSGNDKSKDNAGNKANDAEGGSGGSGNGGSGNTSNAEGGGATTTDEAIDGIASDDDTYGEADADNASGEDSEWNTNGGSAEAGDDENGRGKGEEDMSFANIILMVAGIVIALFIAINAKRRRYKRWLLPVVIALGALGAVLYFVIEDIHGAWALINSHTIYFAIILAAQIAATIIAKRSKVDSGINPE